MAIAFGEAWQLYVWPAHAPRPTLPQLHHSEIIVVVGVVQASNSRSSTDISVLIAGLAQDAVLNGSEPEMNARGRGASGLRW